MYDQDIERLASFNVEDLYGFLYIDTTIKNAKDLPCETLRLRAEEKKKTFVKHDAQSSNGEKLCGQCLLAFRDDASKAVYDAYLEYTKRKSVLDELKSIASVSDEFTKDQAEIYIGQLTQIFKDRKLGRRSTYSFLQD